MNNNEMILFNMAAQLKRIADQLQKMNEEGKSKSNGRKYNEKGFSED